MKNVMLMLIASTITSLIWAQKTPHTRIPEKIKTSFMQEFPAAEKVKWEKEGDNYEAAFVLNNKETSALLNPEGKLLETETHIPLSQLPENVLKYTHSQYPGQNIKEAEIITDAKGIVTYEVELKKTDLIFDSKGAFIKEIKHL